MPAAIALPELLALAGLIVAYGMIKFGTGFTQALFGIADSALGWIPWLGGKAKGPLHKIEQRVNAAMNRAATGVESAIARTWHVLATLIEETGKAIWEATEVGARALWMVEVKYPLDVLSALAHKAQGVTTTVTKVTTTVVKRVTVVQGVTAAQLSRLGRRMNVLEARVKAAAVAVPGSIALPFPRIGSLERRAKAQAKRIGKLERRFGTLAFTALVAGALAKLGAGWIRCTNVRKAGKRVCDMDTDLLETLLGSTLLLTSAISLEQLARELQEPAELVTDAMHRLVREF
jgi:hypothetical protein